MQLLLADLVEVGEVDTERLRRERPTRHVVERVLSQIVELARSINTHIVASSAERETSQLPFQCGATVPDCWRRWLGCVGC